MIAHYAEQLDKAYQDFYANSLTESPNLVRLERLRGEIDRAADNLIAATRDARRQVALDMEKMARRAEVGR